MEKEIQPNELRIGNLVFDSTMNVTKVESIIPEHNRVRHPIPLTEEWIYKFGFFDSDSPNGYPQFYKEDVDMKEGGSATILITKDNDYDIEVFTNFRTDNSPINEIQLPSIKYVHQLQNRYFALTGDELLIK